METGFKNENDCFTPHGSEVFSENYDVRETEAHIINASYGDPSGIGSDAPSESRKEKRDFSDLSVRDLMSDWLNSVSPKVKPSTYAKYETMIRLHIEPYLGCFLLSEIDQHLIDRFVCLMLTEGRRQCRVSDQMPEFSSGTGSSEVFPYPDPSGAGSPLTAAQNLPSGKKNCSIGRQKNLSGLSPKTVSDIMSVLKNALKYAQRRSSFSFDLCFDVSQKQRSGIRVFSPEEQKRLCRYLFENPSPRNLGIFICLCTGLRIGEICALQRENISFEDGVIFVEKTMMRLPVSVLGNRSDREAGSGSGSTGHNNGNRAKNKIENSLSDSPKTMVVITTPKSSCSGRIIPLPAFLVRELKKHCGHFPGKAYILTGSPSEFIEPRNFQYHFKKVLDICQIEDANFHALRHTFATSAAEMGFDIKCLSEILGHSSVNITLNRYVHPSMAAKRKCMEMMDVFCSENICLSNKIECGRYESSRE